MLQFEPEHTPSSIDSNIPLSLGIPANTIGTVSGGLAHTRQEWADLRSLPTVLKITVALMAQSCLDASRPKKSCRLSFSGRLLYSLFYIIRKRSPVCVCQFQPPSFPRWPVSASPP